MTDEKSEEPKGPNIQAFKEMGVGTFARPTLFELDIEGYPKARMRVHAMELENDLIEEFTMYENEEAETTKMLDALRQLCDRNGTWWRSVSPREGETEVKSEKPGFVVTLTRFRRDGTGYLTQKYRIKEMDYRTRLCWDDANKVLAVSVYVGHCEKI